MYFVNVLGTKIGKRHNLIFLDHSSLRLMTGVSKDSKPAIKTVLFIYILFLLSVFSSCLFACRSKLCAKPVEGTDNSYYPTTKIDFQLVDATCIKTSLAKLSDEECVSR